MDSPLLYLYWYILCDISGALKLECLSFNVSCLLNSGWMEFSNGTELSVQSLPNATSPTEVVVASSLNAKRQVRKYGSDAREVPKEILRKPPTSRVRGGSREDAPVSEVYFSTLLFSCRYVVLK